MSSPPSPAPVVPALIAMSALQMLVSCAIFAPGVMAPRIGLEAATLGLYATAACVVSIFTSFAGGMLAGRYGSFRVATFCAVVVLCSTALALHAGPSSLLIVAGVVLGLAYGPETPASSAVLSRITPPQQRPLVFSLRQTGNQSGAMIGSLTLPWLAAADPAYGYVAIMILSVVAVVAFEWLRPRYDPLVQGAASSIKLRDALMVLSGSRELLRLAGVSLPFSALQISLNAFLVTYGVTALGLTLVSAGVLLATAQAGGLIGRLLFGLVATRFLTPLMTLTGVGIGMSACAMVMAFAGPSLPWAALLVLSFAFGITASGWNGVFLAEVARLAPEGRVAEATGAILVPGFTGLVIGPLFVAAAAGLIGLGLAYAILGCATLAGTSLLLIGRRRA